MTDPAIITDILAGVTAPPAGGISPTLIGIFGLPATGKNAVARWLAARFPLVALSTDALRLRYQLASGAATHEVMYAAAAALLPTPSGIVFDGIHLRRHHRLRLRQFAARHHARHALIYTTARPDVIAARLRAWQRDERQAVADGKYVITPEHFARIASWLETPAADEAVWRVDTSAGALETQCAPLSRQLATWLRDPTATARVRQRPIVVAGHALALISLSRHQCSVSIRDLRLDRRGNWVKRWTALFGISLLP